MFANLTDCGELYVVGIGENVGDGAVGRLIVNVAIAMPLYGIPTLPAIALNVVFEVMVIGDEYTGELGVGSDPSIV